MSTEVSLDHTGQSFTNTQRHDTYGAIDASQWDLTGKVVLVSGASRGIGRSTAISFARAGASGIAIGARSAGALEDVEKAMLDAIAQAGGRKNGAPRILRLTLDVTDKAAVDAAAKAIKDTFGRLDILVNNAAFLNRWIKIADADTDEWWKSWTVNVKGTFLVTRALLPLLLESEGGQKVIVNVSSIGALVQIPGASGYQTTKLAILRFTEFVEAEYGARGIIPIAFHPGSVPTEMSNRLPKEILEKHSAMFVDTPELAADNIVWLSKERRQWLSGRYVSSNWDVTELEAKKDEIVRGDKLKVKLVV